MDHNLETTDLSTAGMLTCARETESFSTITGWEDVSWDEMENVRTTTTFSSQSWQYRCTIYSYINE